MKKKLLILIMVIALLPFSVNAQRGCCSHHGGVSHCGKYGMYICNDGVQSPSCGCKKTVSKKSHKSSKKSKKKSTKKKSVKKTNHSTKKHTKSKKKHK